MMDVKRLAAVLATAVGVGLAAGPTLAADPSLTNEVFTGNTASDTLTCTGTTLSFSASGTATGPMVGTFMASGTAGVTAAGQAGSALTSLTASFTIFQNGVAVATGTQKLDTGSGGCSLPPPTEPDVVHAFTDYRAHPHAAGSALMEIGKSATSGTVSFSDQFGVSGP
jgi:hypothetical protein